MLIIPAIDLKDGRCVRLRQGDMRAETIYSEDAAATALRWQQIGAPMLHVVDLNGAVEGEPRNLHQIESILKTVAIPVQIGGGIRTVEAVRLYLSLGACRVVIGTAAIEDAGMLKRACAEFPQRVLLAVDTRQGRLAVRGWTSLSDTSVLDILKRLVSYPLAGIIYTDIARDGMLEGPNLAGLQDVVAHSPFPVIASGGITRVEEIRAIKALGPRIEGVIIGKALYDGKLDLRSALQAVA